MTSDQHEPAAEPLPSQTVRTVASLLLFAHLFALLAAMLSTPLDMMTSRLLLSLGGVRFLSAYTEALWMESAYDFFYTYGNPEFVLALSTDHWMEAELVFADGRTQTLRIPDEHRFPRQRYQRYKNLCNNAARVVGRQGVESLAPAAVATGLLQSTGAESVTLRLKRRLMQTMDQVTSSSSSARDPYDRRYEQTIYTGFARKLPGRPEPDYRKLEEAGETAPTGGSPPSSSAPPATAAPPPVTTAPPPLPTAPPPNRAGPRSFRQQ
jgi:hypothetical protein